MIDIAVLKIAKSQSEYRKIMSSIPVNTLDDKTQKLLGDFGKYFDKFPDHKEIDLQVFLPRFRNWNKSMTDEVFSQYTVILRQIMTPIDEATRDGILGDLYELDMANRINKIVLDYDQGELTADLLDAIQSVLFDYKNKRGFSLEWDDSDIDELLRQELDETGVKWRLDCLNECMRPLREGDWGLVAARPDVGKTTFCTSEMTYMASQIDPDKNILWLNNEGPGSRIIQRLYQSALGLPMSELAELSRAGKLKAEYKKIVGRMDKIRVFNIHGMSVGQVEAIIENNRPGIILYDMIDNIKGFQSEARTDLELERMYQWAREACVRHKSIGLATSQISNEGEGERYPRQNMLKDSKTGKQGALDFQIMIGSISEPQYAESRWMGIVKNKLKREGKPTDPHCEVQFDRDRGRFKDLNLGDI